MGFLDNVRSMKQKIVNAVSSRIKNVFTKSKKRIERRLVAVSPELFKQTDTYYSLISGDLNHEFGFYSGTAQPKVDAVLEAISKIVQVRITTPVVKGERLEGSIEVFFDAGELEAIFDMSEAKIVTEKGFVINWLEWLLTRGNEIVVVGFFYKAIAADKSRSGLGIMVESKAGKTYKVPTQYAGTINDNWITDSLFDDRLVKEYSKIIKEEVERV